LDYKESRVLTVQQLFRLHCLGFLSAYLRILCRRPIIEMGSPIIDKFPTRALRTRTVTTNECNCACSREKQDYAAR